MLELRSTLPITDTKDHAHRDLSKMNPISPSKSAVRAIIPLSVGNYPVRYTGGV